MAETQVTYFVVLNSTMYHANDGFSEGNPAIKAGSGIDVLKDGWYYLLDDGNPDGEGPFETREEAAKAFKEKGLETWQDDIFDEVRNFIGKLREDADGLGISDNDREASLRSHFSQAMLDLDRPS